MNKKEWALRGLRIGIVFVVLCNMLLIFFFSSQTSSESLDVTHKTLNVYYEKTGQDSVEWQEYKDMESFRVFRSKFRDLMHVVEYLSLGFWLFTLIRLYKVKHSKLFSVGIGALYSFSDEIHQAFVPGRSAELFDFCLDSVGVILGVFLAKLIYEIIRRGIAIWDKKARSEKMW